jgi:hypothetical protein
MQTVRCAIHVFSLLYTVISEVSLNYQCCGSALVSMRIQFRFGFISGPDPFPVRIHFRSRSLSRDLMTKSNLFIQRSLQPSKDDMKCLNFLFIYRSFYPSWIRIRIQPTKINADPDPQHRFFNDTVLVSNMQALCSFQAVEITYTRSRPYSGKRNRL